MRYGQFYMDGGLPTHQTWWQFFFKSSDIELEKEQNLEFVGYVEWISQTKADDVKVKLPLIWGFSRNKIRTTDSEIHKRKRK